MNWNALAAALGLAVPGEESARSVVLAHLGLPGNASNDAVMAALARNGDTPRDNVASIVARRQPRNVVASGAWWQVRAQAEGNEAELLIYGDIGEDFWAEESITARELVAALNEIAADTIRVRINSFGGSVYDGLGIYNALKRHRATIIVEVDGYAVSIASLIAMAGDTVRIAENAMFMVHAPLAVLMGMFNARELERFVDQLDVHSLAMISSYANKTGKSRDEILQLVSDGEDHWFTADQAIAFGLADELSEALPIAAHGNIPERFRNKRTPAASSAAPQPVQEYPMNWITLALALGLNLSADTSQDAAKAQVLATLNLGGDADDAAVTAALQQRGVQAAGSPNGVPPGGATRAGADPDPQQIRAQALADEQGRRREIRQAFAHFQGRAGVDDLMTACMDDVNVNAETARARLLDHLGQGSEPIAGAGASTSIVTDQADRMRTGMVHAMLGRRGIAEDPETGERVDASGANPWRGLSARELARACLQAAGHRTEGMQPIDVMRAALGAPMRAGGGNTQSDFPVILENLIQREVLRGFRSIQPTFSRYCRIGDVSDLREWQRMVPGVIAFLEEVDEKGEYKNKNIPDAEKQTIQAKRRGNIIGVTPEVLINDQLGLVLDSAMDVGMAGGRTTERLVYSLFAMNGGDGPTIRYPDGSTGPVFAEALGTKAASGDLGAPSVELLAKGADAMAEQTAPGDDEEYLDIQPAVSVSRHTTARDIQVLVDSQYDPDATNKLQKPNKVRGLVSDIVGSPRIGAAAWYLLADAAVAPVFEVVYLDGQREPRVVTEEVFRSGGINWRADMAVGAGAIGWRGGYRGN
ncbi:head maturation protease, ClpP-related [Algiphilus sp.]|uniref:head maturation protease, ClpP-related n=1 Tax=Algiphilus sp. TaxID=1872431 RepID=UPI0025C27A1A|nr:head maturation protease, ClpP-related [Algiphilus sp.]MCK5769475.1 Clp protease ClpP [Algiphilus sp.]